MWPAMVWIVQMLRERCGCVWWYLFRGFEPVMHFFRDCKEPVTRATGWRNILTLAERSAERRRLTRIQTYVWCAPCGLYYVTRNISPTKRDEKTNCCANWGHRQPTIRTQVQSGQTSVLCRKRDVLQRPEFYHCVLVIRRNDTYRRRYYQTKKRKSF